MADATDKQRARRLVRAQLGVVTLEEYEKQSRVIRERVGALLEQLHIDGRLRGVLSYRALKKRREVDISPLEQQLASVRFDYAPLHVGAPLPSKVYDVILVPLFGFNNQGYRLGHGGGWYDRLLENHPQALKVGVGVEAGLIEFTPEPHDVPMDVVITEARQKTLQKRTSH